MPNLDANGGDSIERAPRETIRAGILTLVFIHFLLDVVLGFFSDDEPAVSSALFFSLIFAQTSLLGMWGGLGGNHWVVRIIGAVIGAIYLWIACGLGIDELETDILYVVALATSLVMAVCWAVRLLTGPIVFVDPREGSAQPPREGLQFGIRHLMLLTFVVACLVTAVKTLAPQLDGLRMMTMLTMIAVCFVGIAVTAIWAMLGLGPPLLRGVVLLAMAGLIGWVLGIVIDEPGPMDHLFWSSVVALQAAYMVASLAIVRRLGYRLLRPRGASRADDG